MNLQPLIEDRALLIGKTLVVADLHLGLEIELGRDGIRVPPVLPDIQSRLEALIAKHQAKKLLILGDLKHAVAYIPYSEEAAMQNFIATLRQKTEVEVIRGNHDGSLEGLPVKMLPATGVLLDNVGLFHGHAWPAAELLSAEVWVLGHLHPMVTLADYFGSLHKEPCWIFGQASKKVLEKNYGKRDLGKPTGKLRPPKIIVMPAFNPLLGGVGINEISEPEGFLSCVDFDKGEVVLLDGTHLGPIKRLRL